jgi:hypothetical protein
MKRTASVLLVIVAAGLFLRSLRLAWQPIWWDEGYSIYFATEPLARMVWLTARDIHPPLYYALLHVWTAVTGTPAPETSRILSVLLGGLALPLVFALARAMFPARRRTAWLSLLLLTFSPVHLYYSQEIRMYGLAVTLGLAATLAWWRWVQAQGQAQGEAQGQAQGQARPRSWPWALAYLVAGIAALYTLYYAALLLAAHAAWAFTRLCKNLRALGALAGIYGLMLLLYLPWLAYAVPQLVGYVGGKVQSDQDTPLGPLAYVERHLVAFTAGQVRLAAIPAESLALAPATVAICAVILGLVLVQTLRGQQPAGARGRGGRHSAEASGARAEAVGSTARAGSGSAPATAALWVWLAVPFVLGWLINLRLPFFPAGGERLLLITLPYLLLLLAYGIDRTWKVAHLGKVAAGAMAINAILGVAAFYTTPRYSADDYRPLIRQMVQQGRDDHNLLAIFPWQVGYWRAYAWPLAPDAQTPPGPQPRLPAEGALEWSPAMLAEIDALLDRGVVWFPEPLTFGSSLPHEIEEYLAARAVPLENRWYEATRLTAWAPLAAPAVQPLDADFGGVRLLRAGTAPPAVESANMPLAATLAWQGEGLTEANISLRLQDAGGHVWSSREYEATLPPPGEVLTETVGMIVPVGLPPGAYQVAVSVQTGEGQPLTIAGSDAVAAVIGEVAVTAPDPLGQGVGLAAIRLPMAHVLARPAAYGELRLLGYSGPDENRAALAGTELAATLFFAKERRSEEEAAIYVSLLDSQGAGVAGYEGWPLGGYPPPVWPENALVQAPVAFDLPGSLASGSYRLVAGFIDPATGEKTPPVELSTLAVRQRAASFTRPTPEVTFSDPPQLGTHARLLGYDIREQGEQGEQTFVRLYWEILQPLLPPHHIFVHLDAPDGQTIAQQDGPPVGVGEAGAQAQPAPTGSWQPGEFLVTEHLLRAPLGEDRSMRVGLYDPVSQARLPVTMGGQAVGDSVTLAQ